MLLLVMLHCRAVIQWAALTLAVGSPLAAGIVQRDRTAPDDLAFSGLFQDLPPGSSGYATRAALAALPVVTLHQRVKPELPVADLVVLPLLELLRAVPLSPGADGLVLKGADGWESYLPLDFVRTYHPYLLLYYDGRPPAGGWPKIYGKKPLAPFYSDISPALGPPLESELEYGYNDANQIVEIQATVTRNRYAPFFSSKLADLSVSASAGRKVFLANCNNCHQGPGEVGGNVSHRPFSLLATLAAANPDYFIKFVRKPTSFDPNTVMPAYGDMSKVDLEHLMAFLREARAAGAE